MNYIKRHWLRNSMLITVALLMVTGFIIPIARGETPPLLREDHSADAAPSPAPVQVDGVVERIAFHPISSTDHHNDNIYTITSRYTMLVNKRFYDVPDSEVVRSTHEGDHVHIEIRGEDEKERAPIPTKFTNLDLP